jgi:hypothetical protein
VAKSLSRVAFCFLLFRVANPVSGKWDLLRAFDARGQADNRRRRIFDTFFNPADRSCNQLPVALRQIGTTGNLAVHADPKSVI